MQDFLKNRPRLGNLGSSPPAGSAARVARGADFPVFDSALLGATHAASEGGNHEVSVEAIKEGDRVTKLLVTCRCGERIEILCAYAPGHR